MAWDQAALATLAAAVAARYGLGGPATVTHIRAGQGQSTIFGVEAASTKAILRLYGPQPADSPALIEAEAAWLRFLAAQGGQVAAPIALADGSLVTTLPGLAGPQHACLFAFAEGSPEWPPTPAQSHALGASLAQLHLTSDGFDGADAARAYDLETLVYGPLARMLPFVPEAAERAYLEQVAAQIAAALRAIPLQAPFYGMIHGDVHQGNAHFRDETVTLFDFSLCGRGWRIYDFTGFLWPLRDDSIEEPGVRAACDAFVAGYESVRRLDAAERAAIAACVKARDFWETGDWIASDPTLGADTLEPWLKTLIARFRHKPLPA